MAVIERTELRGEACGDGALLSQVVSHAERVELVAPDRQDDVTADREGCRHELECVRIADAEAIGILKLQRELAGALARFQAP